MAKKASKKLNIANVIAAVVGIIAIMLFGLLPMVQSNFSLVGDTITNYKGFEMIFGGEAAISYTNTTTILGKTETTTGTDVIEAAFNTMAFVSVLLVFLGVVASLATTFVKQLANNKILTLAAGVLMVVGGILMFTIKGSALTALDVADGFVEYYKLGVGPIIAGIVSILAGVTVSLYPVVKK